MSAKLKAIRAEIQARLVDKTAAGARVSTNRPDTVWQNGLPAIVIYTEQDVAEEDEQGAHESYWRTATIVVHLLNTDENGMPCDDELDDLAEEVEQILFSDMRLGGLCRSFMLKGWDMTVRNGAEYLVGGGRSLWEALYHQETVQGDSAQLAPFKKADTGFAIQTP